MSFYVLCLSNMKVVLSEQLGLQTVARDIFECTFLLFVLEGDAVTMGNMPQVMGGTKAS